MVHRYTASFAFFMAAAGAAGADCLFVNTNGLTVAAFGVQANGSLLTAPGSPFPTGDSGGALPAFGGAALSQTAARLYVTNANSVSGFDIANDCSMTLLPGSPWPAHVSTTALRLEPQENFLYATNYGSGTINAYEIAVDGSLSEIPGSPFFVFSHPIDLEFDPAGGRFFVSQHSEGSVGVFDQAADGTFSPVPGSPFPAGGIEFGLTIAPGATRLYVADDETDTISGFSIAGNGTLTPLPESPYAANSSPMELLVDPLDEFLFVSHREEHSVGVFAIDASGSLTAVAGSPFPAGLPMPAGLATDPDADQLFVAGGTPGEMGDVSVFTIGSDGSLSPISGSPFTTAPTGVTPALAYLPTGGPPGFLIFEDGFESGDAGSWSNSVP